MKTRSIIAISQRVDRLSERSETRDALDQRLIRWTDALDLLALPVPNTLGKDLLQWLEVMNPTFVLLSGGNDIGESPERDRTEIELLEYATQVRMPVLGLCRGMQMMVHFAGGASVSVEGHVATRHRLLRNPLIVPGLPAEVNSFHNLGFATCPHEYQVLATASDGTIEAIRHRTLPWEGWMWHPERETPFGTEDLGRARSLFSERDCL